MNLEVNKEDKIISGFINSNGELEFTIFKNIDGGQLTLEDRVYDNNELLKLLEIELENFVSRNISTFFILGHEILVKSINNEMIMQDNLDEEIYEINQAILDGNDSGDIYVKSLKLKCSWNII